MIAAVESGEGCVLDLLSEVELEAPQGCLGRGGCRGCGAFASVAAAAASAACSPSSPVAATAATAAACGCGHGCRHNAVKPEHLSRRTGRVLLLLLLLLPPPPPLLLFFFFFFFFFSTCIVAEDPKGAASTEEASLGVLHLDERGARRQQGREPRRLGGQAGQDHGCAVAEHAERGEEALPSRPWRKAPLRGQGRYDAELRAYIAAYPESAEARAAAEAATARERAACVANGTALGGHPLSGPASKLSKTDAKMVSKRRLRDRVEDVPYDFELVPKAKGLLPAERPCARGRVHARRLGPRARRRPRGVGRRPDGDPADLQRGGVAQDQGGDGRWHAQERGRGAAARRGVALMLKYIADRLDTDDPIWGYQVRTRAEGWLQGFVIVTDFTTWASYFRFDSQAPSNGITADDVEQRVTDYAVVDAFEADVADAPQNHHDDDDDDDDPETASRSVLTAAIPPLAPGAAGSAAAAAAAARTTTGTPAWPRAKIPTPRRCASPCARPWRSDSGPVIASTTPLLERGGVNLASLMEEEPRWGEPDVEGVVFHTIAEISLLGALGCGAWLLQLVLQELKATGRYKYAILQATDQGDSLLRVDGIHTGGLRREACPW